MTTTCRRRNVEGTYTLIQMGRQTLAMDSEEKMLSAGVNHRTYPLDVGSRCLCCLCRMRSLQSGKVGRSAGLLFQRVARGGAQATYQITGLPNPQTQQTAAMVLPLLHEMEANPKLPGHPLRQQLSCCCGWKEMTCANCYILFVSCGCITSTAMGKIGMEALSSPLSSPSIFLSPPSIFSSPSSISSPISSPPFSRPFPSPSTSRSDTSPTALRPVRRRRRFSPVECELLWSFFCEDPYPRSEQREKLARKLNTTPRRVQIWFQNARRKKNISRNSLRGMVCVSCGTTRSHPIQPMVM